MAVLSNTGIRAGASGAGGSYQIEKSIKFDDDDPAYLGRTLDANGSNTTGTYSFWVKRSKVHTGQERIIHCGTYSAGSSYPSFHIAFNNDYVEMHCYLGGYTVALQTVAKFRDYSAWYHIVCKLDSTEATEANRAFIYVNGVEQALAGTPTYPTQNNYALINYNTEPCWIGRRNTSVTYLMDGYLADVHFIDGTALGPDSFGETDSTTGQWVPIEYSGNTASYGTNGYYLKFDGTDPGEDSSGNDNNWEQTNLVVTSFSEPSHDATSSVWSDSSGWDGSTSTYVYGSPATTWTFSPALTTSSGRLDLHARTGWTWTASTNLGTVTLNESSGTSWPSGGAYNGWHWYSDSSLTTINSISVSAGANWTLQGVQVAGSPSVVGDQFLVAQDAKDPFTIDTPTPFDDGGNGTGNYCTLNPSDNSTNDMLTLSNGNLTTTGGTGDYGQVRATIEMTSGKWYWEVTADDIQSWASAPRAGVCANSVALTGTTGGTDSKSWAYLLAGGSTYGGKGLNGGAYSGTADTFSNGDVGMFAYDADAGKLWFGKNGTWAGSGDPANGSNEFYSNVTAPVIPFVDSYYATTTSNFGAKAFDHTPPTGFKALNTYNLPDPTIKDPSKYFDVSTWEGDDGSSRQITGLNFQPDMVWGKSRDGALIHQLFDIVRGVGASKEVTPNEAWNEGRATDPDTAAYGFISSLTSPTNGFTIGAGTDNTGYKNQYWNKADSYVAWAWDAGTTNVNSSGVGTIDSTYRVNTTAGFSIVTYTGNNTNPSTVAHGLNAKPAMIFVKDRDTDGKEWIVYHKELGATKFMYLNTDSDVSTVAYAWNDTEPTSTVWSMQDFSNMNASGKDYVAYCWSEVEGYSKFGSYTGDYTASGWDGDGPFVHCGFAPRWLMIKTGHSGYNGSWVIYDTARTPSNSGENWLYTNSNAAEAIAATYAVTVTANGFKVRASSTENNANDRNYIFAAFADTPFKYANAQ